MDRVEWLRQVRRQAKSLYDHLAPRYWVTFGFYDNAAHCRFIEKFLGKLEPGS